MSAHPRPQRGTALILVLWLIVLLTALVGGFALAARTEHLQGQALARGLVASNAARAGLEYAITRVGLSDPRLQWRPDGRPYRWRFGDADVVVRLVDENGKVDLNQADPQLIAALLKGEGGVDAGEAGRLAGAIADWRDPDVLTQPGGGGEDADYASAGRPYGAKDGEFESVAELQQVLGFTPALFAKLEPYLTVYSGRARPDAMFAAAPVLDAMGLDGVQAVARRQGEGGVSPETGMPVPAMAEVGSGTYSIDSRARLADGRQSTLRAVVRVGVGGRPGAAYVPLRWEEGASSR